MSAPELIKVQVDSSGGSVLCYNEDRSIMVQANGDMARDLIEGMQMQPLSKVYVMGVVEPGGHLSLSDQRRPDPGW
jgi:hypothetical protein